MDYIKIRFGGSLEQFRSELSRTIDSLFRAANAPISLSPRTWRPEMDVLETAGEIHVFCELAGVAKEDVEVELDNGAVRVAGTRREAPRPPGSRFHLVEIPYGPFERILSLPAPIDPNKATASFGEGILRIRMVKRPLPGPGL
ncbi:MAG: Hsp20/alpha crystallin family protein [Proteobacteria bacterium]|nr:Hsp20/alpha crystallin family protein [Pseudomonadota bacterium]